MEPRAPSDVLVDFERVCRALRAGGSERLAWEWDDRFSAALAVARAPQHEALLALVAAELRSRWDAASLRGAPARIARLSRAWGGLRPGQLMLTRDPGEDPLLLGVWWPWGDGASFSLRVGCDAEGPEAAALDPRAVLRRCFEL